MGRPRKARHNADQFELTFFPPEGAKVSWSNSDDSRKVRGIVISKEEYCRNHFKPGTEEHTEWPETWTDCVPVRVTWTADPHDCGPEIRVIIANALTWEQ